eukprot:m.320973 g.320973  ORF g.320973 m.320973 type:complete len:50 (+) comp16524_c0_seq10:24-173(+)
MKSKHNQSENVTKILTSGKESLKLHWFSTKERGEDVLAPINCHELLAVG